MELSLEETLEQKDEAEYGLFEHFFHKDAFIAEEPKAGQKAEKDESYVLYTCRLDQNRSQSEEALEERVKKPLLSQVDEALQYICNGFIKDTQRTGDEYTERERADIFESAVKLLYRCLFLFYAEARRLLPSDQEKIDFYQQHSIQHLCAEAHKFQWGNRTDTGQYDLWKHLKGLVDAVNDGDPEYGIMGYNGGLFDDGQEQFLGEHQLRNDFLSRALYLLAYVEPYDNESDREYPIPYEDLEVRHLGELYENILEFNVKLADADFIRRRTKRGFDILLASETNKQKGDTLICKGDVFFGESAMELKQTGSYYTPEALVRFLNEKTIIQPLCKKFDTDYRHRFDEFLKEARTGHDEGARRGAAQAAVALIERFAQEEILKFKVCDPAMGSGHFLVDAANQMAGFLVALLEEVPWVKGLNISATSNPNEWRRLITRHCLYGVDLNPLAVTLAKLSLWLNCFAVDHPLTFLDHHLRCGNSLIGLRSLNQLETIPDRKKESGKDKDTRQMLAFDHKDLSPILSQAYQRIISINTINEDDTERQKTIFEEACKVVSPLRPMADLYIAYLMDANISPNNYKTIFEYLAQGKTVEDSSSLNLREIQGMTETYCCRHHVFHWPLEFPDVFGPNTQGGFSATVGNPPWDIIKPNSQEFFSAYDPQFRSYKKQEANHVSKDLMANNPVIAKKWEEYCDGFQEQSTYFREPLNYSALGKGDINTFKLFLERFFTILGNEGRLGIVVPSGIYTDQGCQPLRQLFFKKSRIDFLYCFENRRSIFNIHRSFKFVLFCTQKGGETDTFKCAFMEHDPERLPAIDNDALKIKVKDIIKFSPIELSIVEFNSQEAIDITSVIYEKYPTLGIQLQNNWNIKLSREFDMTNDSHIFIKEQEIGSLKFIKDSCERLLILNDNEKYNDYLSIEDYKKLDYEDKLQLFFPLWEGKRCWFFDSEFEEIQYWIRYNIGRNKLVTDERGYDCDYWRRL